MRLFKKLNKRNKQLKIEINEIKLADFENARYEKKFVINELEKEEIENVVRLHPGLFSEIFYERQVNNLYLDSIGLRSFQEHLIGTAERLKIRIRWYGKMFGDLQKPVLEIKTKRNELANKLHFQLKPFNLDKNFSYSYLRKIFLASKLPNWLIEELKISQLVLLNCYKRKYFLSADKRFRLTLDTNIEFFKIKNHGNLFLENLKSDENILELKYNFKDFEHAEKICQNLPFRMMASSKFMYGIEGLEL